MGDWELGLVLMAFAVGYLIWGVMAEPIPKLVLRCEALARKGTGSGICDWPLDEDGYCPNWRNHLEEKIDGQLQEPV